MKIGHISDLHWLDLAGASPLDFLNKRISGGINLLAGRAKIHSRDVARAAVRAIRAQKCVHLIVSGDLSNLSLAAEFRGVKSMLNEYYSDLEMTIVPGNHDYYTAESHCAKRFERMIYPMRPGCVDVGVDMTWPFVNIVGKVALFGLCSAYPRPWFVAGGRIGEGQLKALEWMLVQREVAGCTKVVVLHHHILQVNMSAGESWRNLEDADALLKLCRKYGVSMIVHGHNHLYELRKTNGIILAEAGSCSVSAFRDENRAGKFNIYDFDADGALREVQTWRYAQESYKLWKTTAAADIPEV